MKIFSLTFSFRDLMRLCAAGAMVLISSMALAADWPEKPIKLVVPWPPGGQVDNFSRIIAEELSKSLGTAVVVDNRPGANGALGTAHVARLDADGYTLLGNNLNGQLATAVFSPDIVTYDPLKDLVPIGIYAETIPVLYVNSALGVRTAEEFIALAKSKDKPIAFGMSGDASLSKLTLQEFARIHDLNFLYVSYKGSGERINALLAGDIQASVIPVPVADGHREAGNFVPLIAFGSERLKEFPDLPALGELGVGGREFTSWFGLFAPSGIPDEVREKLGSVLRSASSSDALAQAVKGKGSRAFFQDEVEARRRLEDEFASLRKLVAESH